MTVACWTCQCLFQSEAEGSGIQNALKTIIQKAQEKAMLEQAYKQFAINQLQAKEQQFPLQEEEMETTNEMDTYAANIMTENRKMAKAIQMLLGKLDTTNEMADVQANWWCIWIPQPVRITLPTSQ